MLAKIRARALLCVCVWGGGVWPTYYHTHKTQHFSQLWQQTLLLDFSLSSLKRKIKMLIDNSCHIIAHLNEQRGITGCLKSMGTILFLEYLFVGSTLKPAPQYVS